MYSKINYGKLKGGIHYTILSEGYDWYLVKVDGKGMYVPSWVF